jgi:hypothetical protein
MGGRDVSGCLPIVNSFKALWAESSTSSKERIEEKIMTLQIRAKPKNSLEVMKRYPRLTGHLICESLGYFTPQAAAQAIHSHINKRPCFCEWYTHMAQGYNEEKAIKVGADTLDRAFKHRHHHLGYMAHYPQAAELVKEVLAGRDGPTFASWF